MKRTLFTYLVAFVVYSTAITQSVLISDDGTTVPDASAILELKSDSMAFLMPRLTYTEIDAIASPAEGLMVYNTSIEMICFFNGTDWLGVDGEPAYREIGEAYQGGIIFYVDETGRSGLIAATSDQGSVDWGCQGTIITSGNGADSRTDGAANTQAILTDCSDPGIAAEICDDYSVVDGGTTYDDWYLPAVEELLLLYQEHTAVGGFDTGENEYYYSSTEGSSAPLNYARRVSFYDGTEDANQKDGYNRYVRPIRAF